MKASNSGYGYLPIELFRTRKSFFVFDARNVCFFEVDQVGFDMLSVLREKKIAINALVDVVCNHTREDIQRAFQELQDAQSKKLLRCYNFKRAYRHDNYEYEALLARKIRGITIIITTQCNLYCSYCLYGGQYRRHEKLSSEYMCWETLKAALDFLELHSRDSDEVRVDFFGGEPMLAFDLIEKGTRYLKSIIQPSGPNITVTISSNGTIITKKILDFLLEHDVVLQFSIDGKRDTHNRHRRFKSSQKGSFDTILLNLQKIYESDPEYFRSNIRIKGVLAHDTIAAGESDFFEHPLVKILINEGCLTFLVIEPHYDLTKDKHYFSELHMLGQELIQMEGITREQDILSKLGTKMQYLYQHTFRRFFDVQATNRKYFAGMNSTPFTKGCLVGYQEAVVKINGDICICHKAAKGDMFIIGNVIEKRWHYDKIKKLNQRLHEEVSDCSSCFIQKICDLCYEKLVGEEGKWNEARKSFCEFNRERYYSIFSYMLQVMENNPILWLDLECLISDCVGKELTENIEFTNKYKKHKGAREYTLI